MNRETLFRHLNRRYCSKRDMLSRIPLGVQPDALWQELLQSRRAQSTTLPLYTSNGSPYWYVTTDKMVAASEKIVETLYSDGNDFDPYTELLPVVTLEESFFTSYVDGSQITMQAAMDFLSSGQTPRDIEEQMISNNRMAGKFAAENLYRGIDADFLCTLAYILTDGMDNGGQEFRVTNDVDFASSDGEIISFPDARLIPNRIGEFCAFLASPVVHPLIKAGAAQGYMQILRPFPEGNDRLGRILSSVILLRAGYTFFSEVSLSALIARKSYAYYEATANILREDNGGDLTYFLEFFLDLLSRAIEERTLRQQRREEQDRKTEMEMARMALTASAAPQAVVSADEPTDDPETDPTPEPDLPPAAEASPEEEGDPLEGFFTISPEETDELAEESEPLQDEPVRQPEELSRLRVQDELFRITEVGGPVTKLGAKLLISYMNEGKKTFTMDELAAGCALPPSQAGTVVSSLRSKRLIRRCDRQGGKYAVYEINPTYALLTRKNYAADIHEAIQTLQNVDRSRRGLRIAKTLSTYLPAGIINVRDCPEYADEALLKHDMLLPMRMGIVDKLCPGVYRINRKKSDREPELSEPQKTLLAELYKAFKTDTFTRLTAIETLDLPDPCVSRDLLELRVLGLLDYSGNEGRLYRLLVTPDDHPLLFGIEPPAANDSGDDEGEYADPDPDKPYSEEFHAMLKTLDGSLTSPRDRRLAHALRLSMGKGIIMKNDYLQWGHTNSQWLKDTELGVDLGLIRRVAYGKFALNKEVQSVHGNMTAHMKKAITAIYNAFGDQVFSSEMIVATLNYSESHTYASLHKLALMKVVDQEFTNEGSRYHLLVNPLEHPEYFSAA